MPLRQFTKNVFTAKRLFIAVIFIVVVVIMMVSSLYVVDFRMREFSEEAGIALWGFPFPMVETGPFYAGYVGQYADRGGPNYIRQQTSLFDAPTIVGSGVFLNFVCYSSMGIAVMLVGKKLLWRQHER